MSVQLRIADGLLHIADEFPEMGCSPRPRSAGRRCCWHSRRCSRRRGAAIRQPQADMFWGDRHGHLEDPFGHRWNIAQHLRDVRHNEVVAAAQAFT